MIKKQKQEVLAKGPPGLLIRKSRDSLGNFRVRSDPPISDARNLTGFENLSGLQKKDCVRVDCLVLLRRPRNDDQNSSVIANEVKQSIGNMGYNNKMMKKDCVRVDDDPERTPVNGVTMGFHHAPEVMRTASLRATEWSVAICGPIGNTNKMKKDCVRVDYFPEGSPINWGSQGFHRAPRAWNDIFHALKARLPELARQGQYNLAQGFGVSAQSNGNALGMNKK